MVVWYSRTTKGRTRWIVHPNFRLHMSKRGEGKRVRERERERERDRNRNRDRDREQKGGMYKYSNYSYVHWKRYPWHVLFRYCTGGLRVGYPGKDMSRAAAAGYSTAQSCMTKLLSSFHTASSLFPRLPTNPNLKKSSRLTSTMPSTFSPAMRLAPAHAPSVSTPLTTP